MPTDGSKTITKCGGSWVRVKKINHSVGSDSNYRTEVYASLVGLLILKYYADYYSVKVQNKIFALYDNKVNTQIQ